MDFYQATKGCVSKGGRGQQFYDKSSGRLLGQVLPVVVQFS